MPRTTMGGDSAPGTGRLPPLRSMLMDAPKIDFEAEGLLEGLDDEQRADRLALLEHLAAEGVSPSELRTATASGALPFLPAERVIGGRNRYTLSEAVERSGIDIASRRAARRASGLPIPEPEEAVYAEEDIASLGEGTSAVRAAGVPDGESLALLRTLGRGMAQAAEAMRAITLRLVLEPGMSEYELARRYADAVSQ